MTDRDQLGVDDLAGDTCPRCHGTGTIQPDPCTPPEPCDCVDEDEPDTRTLAEMIGDDPEQPYPAWMEAPLYGGEEDF